MAEAAEGLPGLSDAEVAALLPDAERDVFVLYLGGAPAGFFELDRRAAEGEVRLTRLALLPEFRGRHLGKWFLGLAVEAAWDFRPERVWTSVGDADDPRAILLYQWAGFIPYETTREGGPGAGRAASRSSLRSGEARRPPGPGQGRSGVAVAPAVGSEDHDSSAVAADEYLHGGGNRRPGGRA